MVLQPISKSHDGLQSETASLSFIKRLDKYQYEKPYRWNGDIDPSKEHLRTNIELEAHHDICLRDLREIIDLGDSERRLSLCKNGFEILQLADEDAVDDNLLKQPEVLTEYLSHIARQLKERLSAELAVFFNFAFRHCSQNHLVNPETTFFKTTGPGSASDPNFPAFPAHADFSRDHGISIAKEFLTTAEADRYLLDDDYRVWIVNMWKPLYKPVTNAPLSLCDPLTMSSPDDLQVVDVVDPKHKEARETRYLRYSPGQEWYWCSRQAPNEISLFKSWDSDPLAAAPAVPHAAARIHSTIIPKSEDGIVRNSLEARMLVVLKRELVEG